MFLQCQDLPPKGAVLELDISLPDRSIVGLTGVVTWHRPDADETGPRGVGLQFDSMDDELGLIVDTLVSSFGGIIILVQCTDPRDRKTLLRMLKSIVGTAEVIFADNDVTASTLLGSDTDLVVVDVDENEEAAIATLGHAQRNSDVPSIALVDNAALSSRATEAGANQVIGNPPSAAILRKAVMTLLSSPRSVSPQL